MAEKSSDFSLFNITTAAKAFKCDMINIFFINFPLRVIENRSLVACFFYFGIFSLNNVIDGRERGHKKSKALFKAVYI